MPRLTGRLYILLSCTVSTSRLLPQSHWTGWLLLLNFRLFVMSIEWFWWIAVINLWRTQLPKEMPSSSKAAQPAAGIWNPELKGEPAGRSRGSESGWGTTPGTGNRSQGHSENNEQAKRKRQRWKPNPGCSNFWPGSGKNVTFGNWLHFAFIFKIQIEF